MKQDLFANLPRELNLDILSRLSFRMIIGCKCVCKPWLNLIESGECRLAKSVPGLAVYEGGQTRSSKSKSKPKPTPYKVYEFVDELDPEYSERYCSKLFNFSLPHDSELLIHSSVNGLLFLFDGVLYHHVYIMIIFNPVTREYIKLPKPPLNELDTFGFGVSKMSGQYKVVRVFINCNQFECQVYTLGTGSWRIIDAPCSGPIKFKLNKHIKGVFMNGNCHWMAYDLEESASICCFDLETELFSTFTTPCPLLLQSHSGYSGCINIISLTTLRDCLCLCESSYLDRNITIWLMNSYGDETSWTRQFIISRTCCGTRLLDCPIKVFKDGDILIATERSRQLLWYSSKAKTMGDTGLVKYYGFNSRTSAVTYAPTFLSLRTFTMEKVRSSFGSQQHQPKSMKRKRSK